MQIVLTDMPLLKVRSLEGGYIEEFNLSVHNDKSLLTKTDSEENSIKQFFKTNYTKTHFNYLRIV